MIWLLALTLSLPNATQTPGVVRPLSLHAICTTAWGRDRRHVTPAMRRAVLQAYGIPWSKRGDYELDHLVPRELGGADDVKNLWPEPWPEAHIKDHAENASHIAVCAGTLPLTQAQQQFMKDFRPLVPKSR